MKVDKSKIVIISTVSNLGLYRQSMKYHPDKIDRVIIDGRNDMHGVDSLIFMFKKLKNTDYEWVIMVDEDVFFTNQDKIFNLIDYMIDNDFTVCGVRDGGMISHRNYNPLAINMFFSIINYKKIKSTLTINDIRENHHVNFKFNFKLPEFKSEFDLKSLKEPYYGFYFWLLSKGYKILYLNIKNSLNDYLSTIVLDHKENELLIHTWYARSYNSSKFHTDRINNVIKKLGSENKLLFNNKEDYKVWKNSSFYARNLIRKTLKKIKMKFVKKYE